jgi:hypothetical protein
LEIGVLMDRVEQGRAWSAFSISQIGKDAVVIGQLRLLGGKDAEQLAVSRMADGAEARPG